MNFSDTLARLQRSRASVISEMERRREFRDTNIVTFFRMTLKRARNDDVTCRARSCWGFTGRIFRATEGAGRSLYAIRGV